MSNPDLLYAKALRTWGREAILALAYGECAELAAEFIRQTYQGRKNASRMLDELADVVIMAEQINHMYRIDPDPIPGRPRELLARAMVLLGDGDMSVHTAQEVVGYMTGAVGQIILPAVQAGEESTLQQARLAKLKRLEEKLARAGRSFPPSPDRAVEVGLRSLPQVPPRFWVPISIQMPPEGVAHWCRWLTRLDRAWWKHENGQPVWYLNSSTRPCEPPDEWDCGSEGLQVSLLAHHAFKEEGQE